VGGIPPRPSRSEAPPPCSFRAEPSKKVFFSFYLPAEASAQAGKKKIGRAQIKKCEENFFARWRALASGGGAERQSSQSGFSSKKVRILTKRLRQFSEFGFWANVASPRQRRGSASARILKGFLKSKNNFCPLKRKFGLPTANINLKNLSTNLFSFAFGERQSDNFKYFDYLITKAI